MKEAKQKGNIQDFRPPVVAVLGHVDHGKTTLLDTIRKSSVASGEHGGITQHIGAYQTAIPNKKGQDPNIPTLITFIDTPGHEAFSAMRSRGANVADVAILVVAADDSVMPQTKESVEQIKAAGIPFIVAMNKIDLEAANPNKVKQDLAKIGVQVEGFGGDVPIVGVSAKNGTGISELLDMILLVYSMNCVVSEPNAPLEAPIIETRVDKGKGMVATVVVRKGTIKVGTLLYSGDTLVGRARGMFDEHKKPVSIVIPGKPVELLGFTSLPPVGSQISDVVGAALESSEKPRMKEKLENELPDFLKPLSEQEGGKRKLTIVLKADTMGSIEAIMGALDPRIVLVDIGIGDITEADILLAKSCKAFVIGFNVVCKGTVVKLAETEKVVYRTYTIIYELLDELSEVVESIEDVLVLEREIGQATIIAEFPYEHTKVAGVRVTSGRLARGDMIKLIRQETEVMRAKIKSIRRGKDEVSKVEEGIECGVLFDRQVDFAVNDGIIAVIK